MGDTYSRIVELLDNSQYIAAVKKAEEEEKLLADLRTLGGKAAVKAYQDTEKAAKKAAAETEKLNAKMAAGPSKFDQLLASVKANNDELKNLHQSANQAGEGLGRIAAAASLIDPQLGAVVAGLQKIEGTIGGVLSLQESLFGAEAAAKAVAEATAEEAAAAADAAAASGDLSAAIGTGVEVGGAAVLILSELAAGYLDYEAGVRAATAAEKDRIDIAQQGVDLDEMVLKAQRTAIEQMGGDAAAKAKEADIDQQWNDVADKLNKTLQDRLDVVQKQIEQGGLASSAAQSLLEDEKQLTAAIAENTAKTKLGADADKAGAEYAREKAEADRKAAKDAKDAADAKAKAAKAAAAQAKADQAALQAQREREAFVKHVNDEETKRIGTIQKTTEEFKKLHDAAVKGAADEAQKIELAAQAQRDELVAAARAAEIATDSADQRKKIEEELREALRAVNEGEVKDLKKTEEEKTKKAKEEAKKRLDVETSFAEDLAGNVADTLDAASEKVGESNKAAGLALWRTSKTIGVVQATIAAYKAAAETVAAVAAIPGGAPFAIPAGLAMFASTEAVTVAKIAATPAPTFDDAALPPVPAGGRRTISFHEQDYIAAAKDPIDLKRHAERVTSGRSPDPSTARRLAQINTGWMLNQQLRLTTRGTGG